MYLNLFLLNYFLYQQLCVLNVPRWPLPQDLSSGLTTAMQFTGPEQINADDDFSINSRLFLILNLSKPPSQCELLCQLCMKKLHCRRMTLPLHLLVFLSSIALVEMIPPYLKHFRNLTYCLIKITLQHFFSFLKKQIIIYKVKSVLQLFLKKSSILHSDKH